MKNDGKLDQDISGRNGEKWLDSEDTSKIEIWPDVEKESKWLLMFLAWENGRMGSPSVEVEKTEVEWIWGGRSIRTSVLDTLSLRCPLDIRVMVSSRQLNMWAWSSDEWYSHPSLIGLDTKNSFLIKMMSWLLYNKLLFLQAVWSNLQNLSFHGVCQVIYRGSQSDGRRVLIHLQLLSILRKYNDLLIQFLSVSSSCEKYFQQVFQLSW